jgi:hypothetical protein
MSAPKPLTWIADPVASVTSWAAVLGRTTSFENLREACGGRITPEALSRLEATPVICLAPEVVVEFLDYVDRRDRIAAGDRSGLTVIVGGRPEIEEVE